MQEKNGKKDKDIIYVHYLLMTQVLIRLQTLKNIIQTEHIYMANRAWKSGGPRLRLPNQHPVIHSSHCGSSEDKVPVDEIYGCLILTLYMLFFRENINLYLHFMSFLHTNKTQVVEIPPRVRQGPAYTT